MGAQTRLLQVLPRFAGALAVLLLGAIHIKWRRWRKEDRELLSRDRDVVAHSGCAIAAVRAFEAQRSDAYVRDPLAVLLCGEQALADYKARIQARATPALPAGGATSTPHTPAAAPSSTTAAAAPSSPPPPASADSSQAPGKRPIPRLIMRTLFFDDLVCAAASSAPAATGTDQLQYIQDLLRHTQGPPCTQVVLLGAGMDSRPWRLDLPPGVTWFEFDQANVIAHKRKLLTQAGAQQDTNTPSTSTASTSANGQYAHPLRVASWQTVTGDLQLPGWSKTLVDVGYDPSARTLWVLEGLLYYFEPDTVKPCLEEAASISGPGSLLGVSIITQRIAAGGSSSSSRGSNTTAGTSTDTAGAGAGAAAASSAASSPPSAADTDRRAGGSGLASKFKFYCTEDPHQFFGGAGWGVLDVAPWDEWATRRGLPTDETQPSQVKFLLAAKQQH